MAAAVWRATWPVERIRQRAFNNFGMEMLLSLNLFQTRDFFAAFFSLSPFHWWAHVMCKLCAHALVTDWSVLMARQLQSATAPC